MNAITQSTPPLSQTPHLLVKKSSQKYYFPFARWNTYVDLYHHLLAYSAMSFIMTGAAGIGKTTLLTQLRERLADVTHSYYLQADDQTSAAQIVRIVQNTFANPATHTDHQPMLIIDDTHELSVTTLDFLVTQIQHPTQWVKGLRLMLCGNELLLQKLAELPISHETLTKLFHHLTLPPVSLAEMKEYLTKRLSLTQQSLSSAQWRQLHQLADGHIDTMLVLAKKMQQDGGVSHRVSLLKRCGIRWIAMGGVIILIAAMLGWGYYMIPTQWKTFPIKTSSEIEPANVNEPTDDNAAVQIESPMVPMESEPNATAASESDMRARQHQLELIKQELALILTERKINYVDISKTGFLMMAQKRARRVGYKESVLQAMRQSQLMQAHSTMVKSKTPKMTQPSGYTIQLLATHNKQALLDFIERHQLKGQTHYFMTLHEGKYWYVLTFGQYATAQAARQALSELPPALHAAKPWPRSFKSIPIVETQRNK